MFEDILHDACERYRPAGRIAYHFARGKLRGDPVYRAVWEGGLLPAEGTLLTHVCDACGHQWKDVSESPSPATGARRDPSP